MRRGATLLELMTVLAILGVIAAVSSLGMNALKQVPRTTLQQMIAAARAQAITSGRPVSITVQDGATMRFNPDGRAIGTGVDPFTGELVDAAR